MKSSDFSKKKQLKEKISLVTCYDHPSARILARSKVDGLLVGDSVAMVVHGHKTPVTATMDMMLLHTQAVARGLGPQLLIADLPFLCHRISLADTVTNVMSLMQAGAQAIKIEGGDSDTCATIAHLVRSGIPIIGHIGLTPQSIYQFGGFKVQGKNTAAAKRLLEEALNLEQAGCSALVLECIPQDLAKAITEKLMIPTIGIGAGAATDGQILVWHDLLGLQYDFSAKFIKEYANCKELMLSAINAYVNEIQAANFPTEEHAY